MRSLCHIVDREGLELAIRDGLVCRREHKSEPLAILNYSARCQYERGAWNAVTTACRGLIYRTDTEEIVARPFRKFFNYGQAEAPTLDVTAPAIVTDKLDGSLGILYPVNGGWAVATRGSFDGEQALHATEVLRGRYPRYAPPDGLTLLFEVVYPDNRIVCDYGDTDDLFLLGAVEIATGRTYPPGGFGWPGPEAETMRYHTLADALAAPPRPNAEGLVVHCPETDDRVKIKQEDYLALHRIVTGLNERTVWEHLKDGGALEALIAPLPDEFHGWARGVGERLLAAVETQSGEVELAYTEILAGLPAGHTRKEFALVAKEHPLRSCLFARLDRKDYRPDLWKNLRPEAVGPRGMAYAEDAA